MAVARTGNYTIIACANNATSHTVTVPSDATFIVVGVAGYESSTANYYGSGSITIGGAAMTLAYDAGSNASTMQCALFFKANPATGSQTLSWDWAGSNNATYGTHLYVSFYTGTSSGSLVATGGEQALVATASAGTLTVSAGVMGVGVGVKWASPLGMDPDWYWSTEVTASSALGNMWGTVGESAIAGGSSIAPWISGGGTNNSIAYMVIAAGSAGSGGGETTAGTGAGGYRTDLTYIASADGAETWTEFTNATQGGTPAIDTDYYIQGSASYSAQATKTGWSSSAFDKGSGVTIAAGDAVFFWIWFGAPNCLNTAALCGMGVGIGSGIGAWNYFKVAGSDSYAYGGWLNISVDPTCAADGSYGSPTSTRQVFGSILNLVTAPSRGYIYSSDCIRYGRSLICTGGQTGNKLCFTDAATSNDSVINRWGLCQAVAGGFQIKGQFIVGDSTNAGDFRDSNRTVLLQDLPRVKSDFTRFIVNQPASVFALTACSITSLGTNARGDFVASGNAEIDLQSCTFTDMGSFTFSSDSVIEDCTFRRCGQITQGGATFEGCTFDSCRTAICLSANDPDLISYCSFTSTGTGHGMEITVAGTYTFDGNLFVGYGASATTDAAIYNNSGGAVTLNIGGGGDSSPTIRNGTAATTTLCAGQVNLTLTSIVTCSEVRIYTAGTTAELAGVENSDTTFVYTYLYSSGTYVDIVVFNVDYEYYRIESYELGNANASLPIAQVVDRQYSNP